MNPTPRQQPQQPSQLPSHAELEMLLIRRTALREKHPIFATPLQHQPYRRFNGDGDDRFGAAGGDESGNASLGLILTHRARTRRISPWGALGNRSTADVLLLRDARVSAREQALSVGDVYRMQSFAAAVHLLLRRRRPHRDSTTTTVSRAVPPEVDAFARAVAKTAENANSGGAPGGGGDAVYASLLRLRSCVLASDYSDADVARFTAAAGDATAQCCRHPRVDVRECVITH